jgi:hypothetical protein
MSRGIGPQFCIRVLASMSLSVITALSRISPLVLAESALSSMLLYVISFSRCMNGVGE